MRYSYVIVLAAIAVACDRPRDTGPVVQPDSPTVGYRDDSASAAARPLTADAADADTVAAPTPPAQPVAPAPPTGGDADVAQVQPTPAGGDGDLPQGVQSTGNPVPVQQNSLTILSTMGPKPTELSHPENEPPAADARAELSARVVNDAGVLRYELTATAPKPWVVKSTTPFNLTLRPSNGVRLRSNVFNRTNFVNPDAPVKQINAELEAAPGSYTIDANVELYVCSADLCKRVNDTVHTAFTIPRS